MLTCPRCGQENPDGFRFCGACGASLEVVPAPRETRKTVTVVFSDVTGSTALGEQLDPESLRRVMGRYFDEMKAVVEAHEGTVEKFIGDAVMAVFGIPIVHEDDALRAVRAAAEMRDRLGALNEELERDWGVRIAVRTGVNTGEVVAGDGSGSQRLTIGDAVNVAKRFEEAASPGEILLGEPTYRLVRDAVDVDPVESLELKGKSEPVSAYRLRSIEPEAAGRARRLESPMVGRKRERSLLQQAYERAAGDGACHLFTVLGAAGVGKSRLVVEFLDGLAENATVGYGRCLPYGEGITFRPLLEVVRRLHGDDLASIEASLGGGGDARLIAEGVASAVGLVEGRSSGEETFWAVRKFLEAEARKRPFVLVFDDIQWGEPTFLDLIEHVADLARDAPILLVCLARPELLDTRPSWGGGKFNATSVLLEPLGDDDSAELIDNLLGRAELASDVRARVAEAAEGNPLFVEEMLGMLIDDGLLERRNGNWVATGGLSSISVPPSIQALLSARLDRLEPDERAVVERGSVEGKVFHRGAVAELAPADLRNDVSGHLQTLVRKELLRPDSAQFAGEDAFRFRHLLIRDAAYNAIPKELRAELHERFAAWLDRAAGARVREYEEILGFHLEQAYKYRDELAPLDEEARALGIRAGTHLGAAGERALARSDAPAAISLLDRAAAVLPASSAMRLKVLCDLGLSLTDRGDLARAEAVLLEATTTAEGSDDTVLTAVANLRLTWVRLLGGPAEMAQSQEEVEDLVRTLEDLGDERAVAEAYSLLGTILMWTGSCSEAVEDFERSISLARRVGADKVAARSVGSLVICSLWGPMPVREGMILCDRIVAETTDRYLVGFAGLVKSFLQMMAGEWAEGRALLEASRQQLEELGQDVNVASTRMASARSEFFAGRLREAEIELRVAYEALEPMGERGYLSSISALLAVVLCAQGRYDDASSYVQRAQELGAKDDFTTEVYWRFAQAEIHASKGEFEIAFRLLDAADAWIDGTDYLADIAFARTSRATVEQAAGNPDRARSALEEAIALLEKKGDVSAADHARERMAQL